MDACGIGALELERRIDVKSVCYNGGLRIRDGNGESWAKVLPPKALGCDRGESLTNVLPKGLRT